MRRKARQGKKDKKGRSDRLQYNLIYTVCNMANAKHSGSGKYLLAAAGAYATVRADVGVHLGRTASGMSWRRCRLGVELMTV